MFWDFFENFKVKLRFDTVQSAQYEYSYSEHTYIIITYYRCGSSKSLQECMLETAASKYVQIQGKYMRTYDCYILHIKFNQKWFVIKIITIYCNYYILSLIQNAPCKCFVRIYHNILFLFPVFSFGAYVTSFPNICVFTPFILCCIFTFASKTVYAIQGSTVPNVWKN